MQIEKFAGEQIAFHLHKKRDFIGRLEKHIQGDSKEADKRQFFEDLLSFLEDELDNLSKSNEASEADIKKR